MIGGLLMLCLMWALLMYALIFWALPSACRRAEIRRFLAQVGRSAKRQDNGDWLGPKGEHAVHEVDAPNISISNPTETGE